MKVRHSTTSGNDKIELQMTPMIDIVFQLLIFFIMTFKIVAMEGDFNIKMPLAAPAAGAPSDIAMPPIKVRLQADAQGRLAAIVFNDESLRGANPMEGLRLKIIDLIGDDRGPGSIQNEVEVELDCDYGLHYEHVIDAITAVSGYLRDDGMVEKLVEKIKFASPRAETGG
ncbi:MAG: ExbD/TolR family protein [Pirellulaceae bacterium]